MLQRIQTIWLLLASLCAFLTLKLSFFSGNTVVNNQKQFQSLTATSPGNLILLILSVAVGIAALVVIFLYKDRKMQIKIALAVFGVSLINIFLFFSATKSFVEGSYDLTAPIVFLIPVFILLAVRGIYKDERLVRSADRLR